MRMGGESTFAPLDGLRRSLVSVAQNTTYRPPVFVPDRIVKEIHAYYHHGGATEFAPMDRAYQIAVGGFFGLPLAIGLILVGSFGVFQMTMTCCPCKCCIPKANWSHRKCFVAIFLIINCALMLCSWVGRNDMQGAAAVAMRLIKNDRKTGLADIFTDLDAASKALDKSGKDITAAIGTLVGAGGCDPPQGPWGSGAAAAASKAADEGVYAQMITPMKDMLGPQASKFGDAGKMLTGMFVGISPKLDMLAKVPLSLYVDMGLGATVAQMLGVLGVGLSGLICSSICFLTMSTGQGTGMLLSIVVIIAAEVFLSVLLSDFCMFGPMKAINMLTQKFMSGADAKMPRDVVAYFTTCEGSNPIAAPMTQALAGLTAISAQLTPLATQKYPGSKSAICDSTAVQAVLDSANATSNSMNTIVRVMGCEHINPIMSNFTNELLCKPVIHGLYHLWVVQASAACFLLVNLFMLSKVKYCLSKPSQYAPLKAAGPDSVNAAGQSNDAAELEQAAGGLRGRVAAKTKALKQKLDAKAAANRCAAAAKEEKKIEKVKEKARELLSVPTPATALSAALEPATTTAPTRDGRRGSVARQGIPEAEISLVVDEAPSSSGATAAVTRYPGSKSVICNSRPLLVGFRATSGATGASVDTFGRGTRGEMGAVEASGCVFPGDSLLCVVCAASGMRDTSRLPFSQVQCLLHDAQCPLELVFLSGGGESDQADGQRQQPRPPLTSRRPSHYGKIAAKPSPMMLRLQARKREVAILRMFFEEIDSDRNGSIQREELLGVLQVLGLQSGDDAMEKMDGDRDGNVSFSEFLAFMTAQAKNGFDLSALIMAAPASSEATVAAPTPAPVAHVFV